MLHFVYLDEFGHDGPFISRTHPRYNTSPVFGLAGFILPYDKVRCFATWFYQLKNNLLAWELKRSGKHPAQWEKKGSSLYTVKNIRKYSDLRAATNRFINRIQRDGGELFYSGLNKYQPPANHDSKALYRVGLTKAIRLLDLKFSRTNDTFVLMLDQHQERTALVKAASQTMFGEDGVRTLLEPPFQLESHLYQTLQCADWICGLMGRWLSHQCNQHDFNDFEWAEHYFGDRIRIAAPSGTIESRGRSEEQRKSGYRHRF
ncbi:MAG: DUF3800 domain-containing protein [Magnetococcales bacterium]|nr:DUF3800 domain-containing protein [Magnetococcales bacterium]MBF0150888.1 DUF3800 domain-containing protein [Magnetococcales bacterium]